MRERPIPLMPIGVASTDHAAHYEAPYRWFIAASLAMGLGGGFMLAVLLPLARAEGWGWSEGIRWQALIQAHGQLQLIGFGGFFVMGMSLRLMPRFAGRPLAYRSFVAILIPLIAASLILRSVAEPWSEGTVRNAALLASAALLFVGSVLFAAVIGRTLLHRGSRAGVTGGFFVLGATGLCAGAALNLVLMIEVVRDGLLIAPVSKQNTQTFILLYGFLLMFISGVGLRAVPTFTGVKQRARATRTTAFLLVCGISIHAGSMCWITYRSYSQSAARLADGGLLAIAAALGLAAWVSGALWPSPNRVAAASQTAFWLVRTAYAWMLASAFLIAWYATRAFRAGGLPDAYEVDAMRHVLTIGVVVTMILGVSMLIVPEFAGRRLQHPDERWLVRGLVVVLNASVLLRLWPTIEGVNWLSTTRYWPIAGSGALASGVVLIFGFLFAQSYLEQRAPGWASPDALRGRGDPPPAVSHDT